jgi:hypothetical protein
MERISKYRPQGSAEIATIPHGKIIAKKFSGECPEEMVRGGTSKSIAHSILGRTALAAGNTEKAKEHLRCKMELLIKSYENMELAYGLLAVGAHELVIEFLEYTRTCGEQRIHRLQKIHTQKNPYLRK